MSESAGKTFRGLQEAYSSIYANKSENLTEDTIVSEVQEEQEFEINEEALCNLFINYLVIEGYVKTEEEALKMIPHIGEEWFNGIVNHLSLSEGFYSCVDSLVKEGYDLSSYKEEDLFESYLEGYCSQNLNEVALAIPAIGAGIGMLGGLANLAKGMQQRRRATTGPSTWDYGQSGTSTYKPKPTPVVKAEDPSASNSIPRSNRTDAQRDAAAKARQQAQSTPAPGPGGGPPEDPEKENTWERALKRRAERKAREEAQRQQKQQQRANQPQTANQRILDKIKDYAADKALGAADFAKDNIKRGASIPLGLGLTLGGAWAGEKFGLAPIADRLSSGMYSQAKDAIKGMIQQNQKSPSQRFREAGRPTDGQSGG